MDGFDTANYLDTLAACYAVNKNWERAVENQKQACESDFIDGAQKRLVIFQRQEVSSRDESRDNRFAVARFIRCQSGFATRKATYEAVSGLFGICE
ncbi:MAG: hypothetical protein AAF483_28060 [Planctomycetota bacterium]